ncbi:MAG: TIGR02921 family PEP-CTERM protein [Prochlorothrix sp.]|nr:TIGR02921 family PEP-CTERM protein [Prochlorothrix sp.]
MKNLLNTACYWIFWLWNLMFLSWAYLLVLPLLAGPLIAATFEGAIPLGFSLSLLGLVAIPTSASLIGATARFRKWPGLLMRFFYGVELPLFGLCLLRMFILRELNPVSAGFLMFLGLSMLSFALEVGFGYAASRPMLAAAQLMGQSLTLMLGLYGGTLLLLYVIPSLCGLGFAVIQALPDLLSFHWLGDFLWGLVRYPAAALGSGLLVVLLIFSATLFLASPFAFCHLYVRSWWRIAEAYGKQWGRSGVLGITSAVAIALVLAFHTSATLPQPQVQAFRLLGVDPANLETIAIETGVSRSTSERGSRQGESTAEIQTETLPIEAIPSDDTQTNNTRTAFIQLAGDRATILDSLPQIRAGLLNAHLHRYRYLGANHRVDNLRRFYENTTALRPSIITTLQSFHNYLISPFLYQGFDWEKDLAPKLYAQIFDTPMQRGERETIQQALQATWNREEAKAGLININQRVIPLTHQAVRVTEASDWGEVEIQERYENPTWQDEEIFYSFSLPETAVITGLWLGDDENPQRYPAVVATRGAAQEVYNQEVQRRVDPALLEQVGPRQYRLRVFPVPAQGNGAPGHAQVVLRYQVLRTPEGWPLPQLTERRNVYWDRQTQRERQGAILKQQDWDTDWGWFEAAMPATDRSKGQFSQTLPSIVDSQPIAHTLNLSGYQVSATPLQPQAQAQDQNQNQDQDQIQHLAVILDSSYSMAAVLPELGANLQQIQVQAPQATLDFYLTAASGAAPQRIDRPTAQSLPRLPFFGSLSLAQMLHQFHRLESEQAIGQLSNDSGSSSGSSPSYQLNPSSNSSYDGILLLADAGSYELEANIEALAPPDAPLWLVHLGPSLPIAYEDAVMTAIEASGGGIATDVASALQRLRLEQGTGPEVRIADGYRWQVQPVVNPAGTTSSTDALDAFDAPNSFAPLAARQLILYRSRTTDMTDLGNLDAVNQIAKDYHLVSPYSSMIALVNDRQRENLAAAEQADDRFDREVEDGSEDLTEPNSPVAATPIPETGTVLGIVLGTGFLWGALRRKYQSQCVSGILD